MVACCLVGCAGGEADVKEPASADEQVSTDENVAASAKKLLEQGNPKKINLVDIVEGSGDDWKAWIKISTAFDPTLSVYSTDSFPSETKAVVITFSVSNMDCEQQDMYWCYQLATADGSVSLWNDTSAADKLTVTGDGKYQFVFDATKALGGAITGVESLQIVFPGLTETTTTVVELESAIALTDEADISLYESKKLD